jgi:hypothetical protein
MADLSPAAQAVLTAADEMFQLVGDGLLTPSPARFIAAATLRALAIRIVGADAVRQDVIDMADELEGKR